MGAKNQHCCFKTVCYNNQNIRGMNVAILQLTTPSQLVVDLRGPEGNAYMLIGLAERLGKTLGFSPDEREDIQIRLKSKDYNHLVHVMEHYFGHCVNFVLPETMLKTWDPNYSIFAAELEDVQVDVTIKTKEQQEEQNQQKPQQETSIASTGSKRTRVKI